MELEKEGNSKGNAALLCLHVPAKQRNSASVLRASELLIL